jgi:hypothetical protein
VHVVSGRTHRPLGRWLLALRVNEGQDGLVDWSTVVAAGVGAAIGLTGDLVGRIGARRQADRQRKEALEDAETVYRRSRAEDLERETRQRVHLAIDRILEAFQRNKVSLIAPDDDRTREGAREILAELGRQELYIPDSGVRRQLILSMDMLDLALVNSSPAGYTLAEVVFVIRANCWTWLGALARQEEIPAPTPDWLELQDSMHDAIEKWHQQLADRGSRVHPPKYNEY